MSSEDERIALAKQCISRAVMEETPTGDPLAAAREYLTAMENIQAATASMVSSSLSDKPQEAAFLLFQVKQKLNVYEERVSLLLGAAQEMGFNDEPGKACPNMDELFKPAENVDVDALLSNLHLPGASEDTTQFPSANSGA